MVHLVVSCHGSLKDVCYLNFVNAHALNSINVINVNNAIFRKRISVFCSVIQLLGNSDHRTITQQRLKWLPVSKDLFGGTRMRTLPEHAPYLTGLIGIKLLSSNIL